MIYSYNWLQKHFTDKLPSPAEIEDGIIFHAFEVESLETKAGDSLLEIKVLPDREHDCLCHRGLAREISAIFKLPLKKYELKNAETTATAKELKISITDPKFGRRYIGRLIENVKVGESPAWIREKLEAVGQRSINNIVDATNYVLFDLGQPMHAFDADKVVGGITVRLAKAGEKITTLDNKTVTLDSSILVIADDEGPLAIAGIKGGNKAEVDQNTKNIILESANFEPVNVRKTSQKIGIRTDASKRYENELTQELADEAMDLLTGLLLESAVTAETKFSEKIDIYPTKAIKREIGIIPADINQILGVEVPVAEMIDILKRLDIGVTSVGPVLKLEIPFCRIDLEVKENIAEEIGRIYGYEKIEKRLLNTPIIRAEESLSMKRFNATNKVRETLVKSGFSEIYGYALVGKGEIELANPLASDKAFLRTNLSDFFQDRLAFNLQNVLFDNEPVKIFEIGRIFKADQEKTSLCLGVGFKKQKKIKEETLRNILSEVYVKLSQEFEVGDINWDVNFQEKTLFGQDCLLGVVEISFDSLVEKTKAFSSPNLSLFISEPKPYKHIPAYPRIIRDIALFVPEETNADEVAQVIKLAAGDWLFEGPIKFDEFHKDGKVSYAFRSVFQSYEKTLSDEEINLVWQKVEEAIKKRGWEVR